jgi:hypothetical protein
MIISLHNIRLLIFNQSKNKCNRVLNTFLLKITIILTIDTISGRSSSARMLLLFVIVVMILGKRPFLTKLIPR